MRPPDRKGRAGVFFLASAKAPVTYRRLWLTQKHGLVLRSSVHRRPQIRSLDEFLTVLLSQAVYVSKRRNFFRNALAWGTGMMAALRLNSAAGPLTAVQTSGWSGRATNWSA